MTAKLENLPLYRQVEEFWSVVVAILDRPGLRRDRDLRGQIERANDSIGANLKEGFEQSTDLSFAHFVGIAKGSTAEVIDRSRTARKKNYITDDELAPILEQGEALGKMMGGFIKYLSNSGFTDRGRHGVAPTPPKPSAPRPPRRR